MSADPETTLFVVAVAVIIRRGDTFLAMRRALSKDAGPGLREALSGASITGRHRSRPPHAKSGRSAA